MEKYLENNLQLLKSLHGKGIQNMYRYSDQPFSRWKDYDDLLIHLSDDRRINCCVEEGKSNVLLSLCSRKESDYMYRKKNIIKNFKGVGFLRNGEFKKILRVGIIKKPHEFNEWHCMSGIRLEARGIQLIFGTCLTSQEIQGLWVLKSNELDSAYGIEYI